jgi:hypothetical protein
MIHHGVFLIASFICILWLSKSTAGYQRIISHQNHIPPPPLFPFAASSSRTKTPRWGNPGKPQGRIQASARDCFDGGVVESAGEDALIYI